MKALSCLASLALYLALAGGLAFLIDRRTGLGPPAIFAGAFAGLFAYGVFGNLFDALGKLREMVSLAKFVGGREPVDGERFVAMGPIEQSGLERLVSPVAQSPAVAYSYRIVHGGAVWEGWGMVSCRIQAGMRSVRLLAFPDLAFPESRYATETAARKAKDYLDSTMFDDPGSFDVRTSVHRNEAGALRYDVGPNEKPASLAGAKLTERVVLPGDVVTVSGIWSAARGGLVVNPSASSYSVTLKKGEPQPAKLFGQAFTKVVNAAFLFAIVTAALTAFLLFVPLDLAEERDASLRPSWLEVEAESRLDESLRPLAIEAGLFPTFPTPGSSLQPGEARGRIRTPSGEAVATHATAERRGDAIEVLLHENDRPIARLTLGPDGRLVAAELLGVAIEPAALPQSGFVFSEFAGTIAGRLSFILPDGPAARVRFRAHVAGARD